MNKLRKIIALMLSLSVIFTAAISVFSAENFDDDGNRDNDAGLSDEEQNVLIQDSHPKHEPVSYTHLLRDDFGLTILLLRILVINSQDNQ